jgi:hypothetical protein
MMKRRSFIAMAIAAFATPALPAFPALQIQNENLIGKMLSSFPAMEKTPEKEFAFFMTTRRRDDEGNSEITFSIEKVITQDKNMDKFFDDIEELDMSERQEKHRVSAMVSGGSRIAVKTRRGRGNHYIVFPDHILIWYSGNYETTAAKYDTPLQTFGDDTIALNPNFSDYFIKIKNIKLTNEDHSLLKELNFKRIA